MPRAHRLQTGAALPADPAPGRGVGSRVVDCQTSIGIIDMQVAPDIQAKIGSPH